MSRTVNLQGYQNYIIGSKVTGICLNGWILSIGGVASGRVCACSRIILPQYMAPNSIATILT